MTINQLEWKITLDEKTYGAKIDINTTLTGRQNDPDALRRQIQIILEQDIMPVITQQIISSTQKILTGKTQLEALVEKTNAALDLNKGLL